MKHKHSFPLKLIATVICGFCGFSALSSFSQTKSAVNGEVFTPKGDLKALIIFAGFEGHDQNQKIENWPAENDLPNYVINGKIPSLFFSDRATL